MENILTVLSSEPSKNQPCIILEKFSRISLYMTDDAIYCKALCEVKFSHIEGNGRKFRHIELSISVIS